MAESLSINITLQVVLNHIVSVGKLYIFFPVGCN